MSILISLLARLHPDDVLLQPLHIPPAHHTSAAAWAGFDIHAARSVEGDDAVLSVERDATVSAGHTGSLSTVATSARRESGIALSDPARNPYHVPRCIAATRQHCTPGRRPSSAGWCVSGAWRRLRHDAVRDSRLPRLKCAVGNRTR